MEVAELKKQLLESVETLKNSTDPIQKQQSADRLIYFIEETL